MKSSIVSHALFPRLGACGLAAAALVSGVAFLAPVPADAQWFGVYERYERPFVERRWVEPRWEEDDWEERGWRSRRGPRVVIEEDALTPGEVARVLRRQGLRPVGPVRRIGERYRVEVEDRAGRRLRALVDAYEGAIVNLSQQAALPDAAVPNLREPAIIPAPRNVAPVPPVRPAQASAEPRVIPAPPRPVAVPKDAASGPARAAVIEVEPDRDIPAAAPLE